MNALTGVAAAAVEVETEVATEEATEVDVTGTEDAADDRMGTPVPSMLMTRLLSLRYHENSNLADCGTPSVKMIRLQHDTTTCIFSASFLFPTAISFVVLLRVYSS